VAIAWLGFFLEFTPKIQKGVLYLVSIVTNIATVTIGGTLAEILTQNDEFNKFNENEKNIFNCINIYFWMF
jgi:hypothetical protein